VQEPVVIRTSRAPLGQSDDDREPPIVAGSWGLAAFFHDELIVAVASARGSNVGKDQSAAQAAQVPR
jgi:hypothetical protein